MQDPSQVTKAFCPHCSAYEKVSVLTDYRRTFESEEGSEEEQYILFECLHCENSFVLRELMASDHFEVRHDKQGNGYVIHPIIKTTWPHPKKHARPEWMYALGWHDGVLQRLMLSVYTAIDYNLNVLAAIGLRTAFDRTCDVLQIDPAKSFSSKLGQLLQHGHIGITEKRSLEILTDAGSAAAHRGWEPSDEQLETLSSIIEQFIYRTLILDSATQHLRSKIPTRQNPTPGRGP